MLAGGLALGLGACFSGADFTDCPQGDECGTYHTCVVGTCVPNFELENDTGSTADARPDQSTATDLGDDGLDILDLQGQVLFEDIDARGKRVLLGDNRVTNEHLVINAAIIEVRGPIDADGAGKPGGGGGGGGAGGLLGDNPAGGGGGLNADAGQGTAGHPGGRGGVGGSGLGEGAGQGGTPGTGDRPDGGDATPAIYLNGSPCADLNYFKPGNGGGGGGGGRGSNGRDDDTNPVCQISGGGGGGGGAGGPGGGAFALEATEKIIIGATISARGLPAPDAAHAPVHRGGTSCSAGPAAQCPMQTCSDRTTRGGTGSDDTLPGIKGAPDAGNGGHGSAGSGGTVRLFAPDIVLNDGARFDVTGGANNPGAVMVLGTLDGISPNSEGGAPVCRQ
jgi:hypothetical protein